MNASANLELLRDQIAASFNVPDGYSQSCVDDQCKRWAADLDFQIDQVRRLEAAAVPVGTVTSP